MLKEKYSEELEETSIRLAKTIARELDDAFKIGRQLDVEVRELVLELGAQLTENLLEIASLVTIERGLRQV